jgi:hypothetical protein
MGGALLSHSTAASCVANYSNRIPLQVMVRLLVQAVAHLPGYASDLRNTAKGASLLWRAGPSRQHFLKPHSDTRVANLHSSAWPHTGAGGWAWRAATHPVHHI